MGSQGAATAPHFTVVNVDTGAEISNEEIAGSWVLIDFWATWCGACVAAIPDLERAHASFSGYGLDILSVSLDADAGDVARFRERRSEMPWMHAVPAGGMRSDIARAFRINGVPTYFLVAPDGTIAARGSALRGANLAATLERLVMR